MAQVNMGHLAKNGFKVHGIELSYEMVNLSKKYKGLLVNREI